MRVKLCAVAVLAGLAFGPAALAQERGPAAVVPPVAGVATLSSDMHLIMAPNRRATIAVGDDSRISLKAEAEQTAPFEGGPSPQPNTGAWFKPEDVQHNAGPGELAFTLWSKPGETLLKLENGLDRPVVYVAALITTQNGQRVRTLTSICAAAAGGSSVEMWPDPVEGIEIAQILRLPANSAVCIDPQTQKMYRPGQAPDVVPPPGPAPRRPRPEPRYRDAPAPVAGLERPLAAG